MELKKGLYVGCGLTYAPEDFKEGVAGVKAALSQRGYDILEFVGERSASPAEVYIHDIKQCVEVAKAMLAIVDYPSSGLGWEMATADKIGIPALVVARVGRTVSRLVLGAAEVIPSFRFQRYEEFRDIADQLDCFLELSARQPID